MKDEILNSKMPFLIDYRGDVKKRVNKFILAIKERKEDLINILLTYESYDVAEDEITRTLDLFENIDENEEYFKIQIGVVASFLPRNQPLYALGCFVIIPSLMSKEVHFRIPNSMQDFLPKLLSLLDIILLFPNIIVSDKKRIDFLKEHSALLINPNTGETKSVTDAVIFTGTSKLADQLRNVFNKETLFISNGSGHNPIIVSNDADLQNSVEAVYELCLYNQGQDCAAPNAVLVHKDIHKNFLSLLNKNISEIKIGEYSDRTCKIGPLNDPKHLNKVQAFLINNREWIDKNTKGIIRTADSIVEPTIVTRPLKEGGNFEETFAPIIFIQKYDDDQDLSLYFEDSQYENNAMYITLYGNSKYINNFVENALSSKKTKLHGKETFLHNTHLHSPGVERGTRPYGGYGYGASSVSINGKTIPKPTLPQRDLYELVAIPLLSKKPEKIFNHLNEVFSDLRIKNVEKIIKVHQLGKEEKILKNESHDNAYFDITSLKNLNNRYIKVRDENMHYLLNLPNIEYSNQLSKNDLHNINLLKKIIDKKSIVPLDEFIFLLYTIPKNDSADEAQNKKNQYHFFQVIYHLLFGVGTGPKLGIFLWEADGVLLNELLDF